MISIVNYGVGNLASIHNMLRKAGVRSVVTNEASEILAAEKIILPGVGHYDHAMTMLNRSGLRHALEKVVIDLGRPVLGICLGAQILGSRSEEGELSGLGWIDMVCKKIPANSGIRVPHMGWNAISMKKESTLFKFAAADARYYFVHSYYMECARTSDAVGATQHGIDFTSVVQKGNIYGTQFHPEKSLRHGLAVLKAFSRLNEDE